MGKVKRLDLTNSLNSIAFRAVRHKRHDTVLLDVMVGDRIVLTRFPLKFDSPGFEKALVLRLQLALEAYARDSGKEYGAIKVDKGYTWQPLNAFWEGDQEMKLCPERRYRECRRLGSCGRVTDPEEAKNKFLACRRVGHLEKSWEAENEK